MKVLYGVQGTGNGHITRARAMQKALAEAKIEVDWVFSGRESDRFFDMDEFGSYRVFKGLTFATKAGKIDLIKTFADASLRQMYQDITTLEMDNYDLVITDFEPVVAWAARKQGRPCLGIGHQYAFEHKIPKAENSIASDAIMKWFAPVTQGIGVHWHHFGQPILPPIIEADSHIGRGNNKTLVYLPFEKSKKVLAVLNRFEHPFIYHCADIEAGQYGNVLVKGFSRSGFQESLHATDGVICNAGFELASEALSLGRKLMVKPLKGQMEQASNALAITELNLGLSVPKINVKSIARYLSEAQLVQVNYPDVPSILATWLKNHSSQTLDSLVADAWNGVHLPSDKALPLYSQAS